MQKGLWSHRTRIQVANPEAESWSFRASEDVSPDSPSIDAVAIDDILSEIGSSAIDLLKIDIEGGEFEVFSRGASRWIDRVGTIAVELHDHLKPGCSAAVRQAAEGHRFIESQWAEYLVLRRARECADQKGFA
jgi:hypothetical protein